MNRLHVANHEISKRIRCRLSRPRHPFILALAVAILIYYAVEGAIFLHLYTISTAAVLIAVMEITTTVVLPLFPDIGCWMLGLIYPLSYWETLTTTPRGAVTIGIPPRTVMELVIMYALAVAVSSYFSLVNGLVMSAVLACDAPLITVDVNPFGNETDELILLLMLGLVMVMLGTGIRLAREKTAAEHAQRQQQKKMTIASQLHDHLCNELTVLLLETSQDPEFTALSRADKYTKILQHSIAQTREIITELDGKKQKPHTASIRPQWSTDTLQSIVERQKRHMDALGFTGMTYMNVDEHFLFPDATRARLADDLITELFGNIAKHADPADGYFFSVSTSPTALTVSLADTPRQEQHNELTTTIINNNHTGLQRLQERMEQTGGTIEMESTPDRWSFIARMPLK